jgi:hypothetical protein
MNADQVASDKESTITDLIFCRTVKKFDDRKHKSGKFTNYSERPKVPPQVDASRWMRKP